MNEQVGDLVIWDECTKMPRISQHAIQKKALTVFYTHETTLNLTSHRYCQKTNELTFDQKDVCCLLSLFLSLCPSFPFSLLTGMTKVCHVKSCARLQSVQKGLLVYLRRNHIIAYISILQEGVNDHLAC